jgi:hypothetical protein
MAEIAASAPRAAEAKREAPAPPAAEDRMEKARRTLPRRRFFNDMPDKGLFALVALGGFFAIILVKANTHVSSEIVAAAAVLAMILYGAIAFRLPEVQVRTDRLGDNFYYLGFIFTLASLSAALIQLRTTPNIEDLLGNFGIALITTVIGVAGRVLFVQMRGEIDAIEEQVRRDLVSASAELRSQLALALREFETFQRGVMQAASESVKTVAEETEANIKKMAAAGTARVSEAVGDGHRQAEVLAGMLIRVNKVVSELPMMSKLELPNERLERQIGTLAAEIQSLVEQLSQVTGMVRQRSGAGRRRWYWLFLRKT